MAVSFRSHFLSGLGVVVLIALFLLWLWQPERQIERHTENLFRSIEHGNWSKLAELIESDYHDQWGHDRAGILERVRDAFRFLRGMKLNHAPGAVKIENSHGRWVGKITLETNDDEVARPIKVSINSLATPFELEWHHTSGKPWDWKLSRVTNPDLEIPPGGY